VASGIFQQPKQRQGPPPAESAVPFEVACACGRPVRGQRRSAHQVVPCPNCGQALFILPRGAWSSGVATRTGPATAPASHRLLWRLALAASAAAVLGVVLLYLVLSPYLSRRPNDPTAPQSAADVRQNFEAGRQALAGGNYHRGRQLLGEALNRRDQQPQGLNPEETRELRRLHRQAGLLARLLPLSLEELLHQGRRVNDDQEWADLFAEYYRGRTVLFDDVVRRNPAGKPVLAVYAVADDGVPARLALEDLTLWQRVPLEPPPRLLFGACLKGLAREEGGAWVVRFEPDSGVLLTDPKVAATVCPAPLGPGLLDVLRQQAEWDRQ
jgi:hypothetical protein